MVFRKKIKKITTKIMSSNNNRSSPTNKSNIKTRSQSIGGISRITKLKASENQIQIHRGSVPNISENNSSGESQVPIVFDKTESFIKLKSCLKSESIIKSKSQKSDQTENNNNNNSSSKPKSDSDPTLPPSMRPDYRNSESLNIRFSQMVNLREYDGELAPETVRKTNQQPIYRITNFRVDQNNFIVDDNDNNNNKGSKPIKKVQLESFKVTRHHLNGSIKAKSMSLDQQCYIRVTTDNWVTFQETEAIDTGDDSSPMLTKYHFDFIIPIPRHESNTDNNCATNTNTLINSDSPPSSQTSLISSKTSSIRNLDNNNSISKTSNLSSTSTLFSIKDCPQGMEFFVVLKSLGMLYIDDNDKQKYKLKLIQPRASVVPVISLTSKSSAGSNKI